MLLFAGIVVYTFYTVRASRRAAPEVAGRIDDGLLMARRRRRLALDALRSAVGLGLLVWGAAWLVDGATAMARALGVNELVIGLTIVAAGTSLPELATSVVAALRRHTDIAVGNIVGSNIFNLMAVLGASAAVAPGGVEVPEKAIGFDLPVMVLVAVACGPVFLSGHRVGRWEGVLFVLVYAGYLTWRLATVGAPGPPPLYLVIAVFGLPLAGLTWLPLARRRGPR